MCTLDTNVEKDLPPLYQDKDVPNTHKKTEATAGDKAGKPEMATLNV